MKFSNLGSPSSDFQIILAGVSKPLIIISDANLDKPCTIADLMNRLDWYCCNFELIPVRVMALVNSSPSTYASSIAWQPPCPKFCMLCSSSERKKGRMVRKGRSKAKIGDY